MQNENDKPKLVLIHYRLLPVEMGERKMRITGYIPAMMVNIGKCPVYEEDTDDITFLTDKLITEGLTKKEREELDFLRELSSL